MCRWPSYHTCVVSNVQIAKLSYTCDIRCEDAQAIVWYQLCRWPSYHTRLISDVQMAKLLCAIKCADSQAVMWYQICRWPSYHTCVLFDRWSAFFTYHMDLQKEGWKNKLYKFCCLNKILTSALILLETLQKHVLERRTYVNFIYCLLVLARTNYQNSITKSNPKSVGKLKCSLCNVYWQIWKFDDLSPILSTKWREGEYSNKELISGVDNPHFGGVLC